MSYVARMPENLSQFEENLKKIYDNKGHIAGIKANEAASHLEVDLDWKANSFGGEAGKDFYLPIKRGKLREAMEIVNKLMRGDHGPTRSEASHLYDLLDPQSK